MMFFTESYYFVSLPLLLFIELLGLIGAIHAIMSARSSQGAIAWAISLVTFPYITVPLYLMLGGNRFRGYAEIYRTIDVQYDRFIQLAFCEINNRFPANLPQSLTLLQKSAKFLGVTFTSGNLAQLLINGEQTYQQILAAIAQATHYILIQFYIVRDDEIGNEIKNALLKKVQQQVQVYFIYDEIGSHNLSDRYLQELDEGGVLITAFHSNKSSRFQVNFRNHRKIVVIDGKTAFVGGLNIGDEYLGKCPEIGHWRDTHLQLQGPAVQQLQLIFLKDWYWAVGDLPELCWEVETHADHQASVLILPSGPADEMSNCTLFFVSVFNSAKQRLWIASPYFVPDDVLVVALQMAALRGVDVRILIPEKADHRLVQLASYSYYGEMLSVGVKLYRYHAGFMHQKVILVDEVMASIGTVNLDNRSFKLNFEVTAFVIEPTLVKGVANMLLADFAAAHLVNRFETKEHSFWQQLAIKLSRLLSPLL